MDTCEDQPADTTSPDGSHIRIQDIVKDLRCVVELYHRVDREYAECHHGKRENPE